MSNRVEFSPEIVRLAQARAEETGTNLANELARLAVEEVIMNADPELDLVMEPENALSAIDSVVSAIGANDIVVNGRHIDVRAIDENGHVSLSKSLVGTPALSSGTLVVSLDGSTTASVIAHIKAGSWLNTEGKFGDQDAVKVEVEAGNDFDAVGTIHGICQRVQIPVTVSRLPEEDEISKFLNAPESMILARQKQIVTALCAKAEVRDIARDIKPDLSRGTVNRMLRAQSTWNRRTEELVDKISPKMPSLTREQLKRHISLTGEELGGQPEAPAFRKALLKRLSADELSHRLGGAAATKVKSLYDQITAGQSAKDAVKSILKNNVAVDIAHAIKTQRGRIEGFLAATSEEIGQALQQLAVQPAYATHSSNKDAGTETINEALILLEVGEVAENISVIEKELVEG
ncbi:MAG: hypothetical protein K2X93_26980 [Candidatus Obscuribacterales bacterium]|nr:hypothetical protein [Candidatus Obscuribacterales bacterium]